MTPAPKHIKKKKDQPLSHQINERTKMTMNHKGHCVVKKVLAICGCITKKITIFLIERAN